MRVDQSVDLLRRRLIRVPSNDDQHWPPSEAAIHYKRFTDRLLLHRRGQLLPKSVDRLLISWEVGPNVLEAARFGRESRKVGLDEFRQRCNTRIRHNQLSRRHGSGAAFETRLTPLGAFLLCLISNRQLLLQFERRKQRTSLLAANFGDHERKRVTRLLDHVRSFGGDQEGKVDQVKVCEVVEVPARDRTQRVVQPSCRVWAIDSSR